MKFKKRIFDGFGSQATPFVRAVEIVIIGTVSTILSRASYMGSMKLYKKAFLTFVIFLSLDVYGVSIQIDTPSDAQDLEAFFKLGIEEHGFGSVLEGNKPVAVCDFYSLDALPIHDSFRLGKERVLSTILCKKALKVWRERCSSQKNYILKAVSISKGELELGWEIMFINVSALRKIIDENINLFRYALGPTTTTDNLIRRIAFSNDKLSEVSNYDPILEGIILGFGAHNSIFGGRLDIAGSSLFSRDTPPYNSKAPAFAKHYKESYLELASGEDYGFATTFFNSNPSLGFQSFEDEYAEIEKWHEELPSCLYEKPIYIFGPYKGGPSNEPFVDSLKASQIRLRNLLEKDAFLEEFLSIVGGDKAQIIPFKSLPPTLQYSLDADVWRHILISHMNHLEEPSQKLVFLENLFQENEKTNLQFQDNALKGLLIAKSNLKDAEEKFNNYSSDMSLKEVSPKKLYYKISKFGSGPELTSHERVRVSYIFENLEGKTLFANYNTWIELSKTIPGFAHGIQGMQKDEERELYIHPSLAYGAYTNLPSNIGLVAKIKLLDFENKKVPLSPLQPQDLSWVNDPELFEELQESAQNRPYLYASFFRQLLLLLDQEERNAIQEKMKAEISVQTKIVRGVAPSELNPI